MALRAVVKREETSRPAKFFELASDAGIHVDKIMQALVQIRSTLSQLYLQSLDQIGRGTTWSGRQWRINLYAWRVTTNPPPDSA